MGFFDGNIDGPLDSLFDFNRDGHLDSLEKGAEIGFIVNAMEEDEASKVKDDGYLDSSVDKTECWGK